MMPKEKIKEFEEDILYLQKLDEESSLRNKEYEFLKSLKALVKTPMKIGNEIYQLLPPSVLDLASEDRIIKYREDTSLLEKKRSIAYENYKNKYIREYIKYRPTFKEWMLKNNATLLSNIKVSSPFLSSGNNLCHYVKLGEKYKTSIRVPLKYNMDWKYLGFYKNVEILLREFSIKVSDLEESVMIMSGHLFIPKMNQIIRADFTIGK